MQEAWDALVGLFMMLPLWMGQMAHDNVDLGMGMTPAQLSDCYAGVEGVALVCIAFCLFRRMTGKKPAAPAE